MSNYQVGDHVTIAGKVMNVDEFYGLITIDSPEIATTLVFGLESPNITKIDPPLPPEPTGDVRVEDKQGDFWAKSAAGLWGMTGSEYAGHTWAELHETYGPLTVWERAS